MTIEKKLELGAEAAVEDGMDVWDTLRWDDRLNPYVHGRFDLTLSFATAVATTVVTLDIPSSHRPSSLKGNYHLAHPSQRHGDRRSVRLLYFGQSVIRLHAGITRLDETTSVWINEAKAAALVGFGLILSYLVSGGSSEEVLVSVLLGLGAFGFAHNGLFDSTIYAGSKHPLRRLELVSVMAAVAAYLYLAVPVLAGSRSTFAPRLVGIIVLVVLSVVVLVGAWLHRQGAFGGFSCDLCDEPIRLRRGHNECFFTGRVPCDTHVAKVCAGCPHYLDLGSPILTTRDSYDSAGLPCVNYSWNS
jgi:hypothetical protein